jgi:colanic acid biosynthesis glycosyl transferase WcaI
MRVLVVSQLFRPEMGALPNRLYPITRHLAEKGHDVSVATGMPNYPRGKVFPAYRGKWFVRESLDGVTVLRTIYVTTPRNVSKLPQLLSYLSFVPAVLHSGWRSGPADVVFVTSPPIFAAVPAIALAKLRRAKLVVDLRDLWPDELVACGAARERSLSVRALRRLERWIYRSADIVTCTTPAFVDVVAERGVGEEKSRLLPNGADLELFRPLPRDNPVARAYPFGDRFTVMYSGLLGIKHGLETLLEAAARLRDRPDVLFVLVGDGPRRAALMRRANDLGLDNVIFTGERGVEDLPYLLARADVCVTNLLPEPYLEKIVPTKIFEYLACGKPVVGGLAGEGARVLEESGGGIAVRPGDAAAMVEAILALHGSPERRAALGEAGRRHVARHYSRSATAARLEEILSRLAMQQDGLREPASRHPV